MVLHIAAASTATAMCQVQPFSMQGASKPNCSVLVPWHGRLLEYAALRGSLDIYRHVLPTDLIYLGENSNFLQTSMQR